MEKRRFFRHPLKVPIQYYEVRSQTIDNSSSIDLSQGGLCFLSERFFSKGTLMDVSIPVKEEVFRIQGQVAYCNRVADSDRYRTGLAFRDSASAFNAKLAEQIHLIQAYQEKLSRDRKEEVSEEEAARAWIDKYAKHFSHLF